MTAMRRRSDADIKDASEAVILANNICRRTLILLLLKIKTEESIMIKDHYSRSSFLQSTSRLRVMTDSQIEEIHSAALDILSAAGA